MKIPGERVFSGAAARGLPGSFVALPTSREREEFAWPGWSPELVSVFTEYLEISVTFGRVFHPSRQGHSPFVRSARRGVFRHVGHT
jgi:hypothetical protein